MHELDEQIISSGTAGLCPAGPFRRRRRRRVAGAVNATAAAAMARTRSRPVAGRGRFGPRARRAKTSSPAVPRAEPAGTLRHRRRCRVAAAVRTEPRMWCARASSRRRRRRRAPGAARGPARPLHHRRRRAPGAAARTLGWSRDM